jgi:preprotein translocase subunit SecD
MDRGWYTRLALVVICIGLAGYVLYPSYFYFTQATQEQRDDHDAFCKALPFWMNCSKFNLGLDLQGGVHLVMGVEVDKAVEQRADRLADGLRDGLTGEKILFVKIERPRNTADIVLTFDDKSDIGAIEKYIRREFSILDLPRREGNKLTLNLLDSEAEFTRTLAVEQTIKTIRNRADRLGVTEPTIAKRGTNNVLIQLPGVKDPQRAIDIIGRTAQLEFKIVDEEATAVFDEITDLPDGVTKDETSFSGPGGDPIREVFFVLPESKKDEVRRLLEEKIDSTREVAFGAANLPNGSAIPDKLRTYVLQAKAGITGDYLTNAQWNQNPDLRTDYFVTMTFDNKGAKIFGNLTEENVQRHMAIVLDDTVNSAPIIQERIGGGSARITLGSSGSPQQKFEEAKDLALVLKAGALPAPVEIREQRRVGKTLGEESVNSGALAIKVGGLLVIVFMLLYYKASGLIANIALTLNVIFVLAILALFEATLTLPGMAGIVLTIGMAVDANVIIFERIREELRIGKTPRAAVDAGYARAFSTILDANVTTLIAGVVLMEYGSGPVRGFAVTLIVGIICSMFTAIVVTRLIFDFFTGRRRLQSLSI